MADTKSGSGRHSAAGGSGNAVLSPLGQGPANLECKDFQEYLRTRQTPESLEKLYNYPPICLAVFRELPEIARQFIIRILFVDQPVPQAVVTSWGAQRCAKYDCIQLDKQYHCNALLLQGASRGNQLPDGFERLAGHSHSGWPFCVGALAHLQEKRTPGAAEQYKNTSRSTCAE